MKTAALRTNVDGLKGERQGVLQRKDVLETTLKGMEARAAAIDEARELLRTVALETQEQLRYHIEEIVGLAMTAVLDDPYELEADFVLKRGKTECELWFSRDGERVKPIDASGGGAVDVASFALRVAVWGLRNPRSRALIVLDEPFRFLSAGLQSRASDMLKELSLRLGIQFLIVTHNEVLTGGADHVFKTGMRRGVSTIVVEGGEG